MNAEPQQPSNNSGSSGDLVTFTDQNNYFQIDVPADWTYKQSTGDNYYWDTFTSPDGDASIENITYDNGDPFPGETNGKFALNLLHQFYSVDGKEGDIRVKEDSIQKGGSERLIWNSRGRGTTGISFFVVRNGTTFLMFTSVYPTEQESQYLDTLNKVISSYVVP